jgi:DHA2 family multidrug resistance protein
MGREHFIITGLIQGAGLGLVFIPLNLMAFATLSPAYRTEGSSLLNLARNIGASVGISVVTTVLAVNVQTSHQELGGHVTAYSLSAIDPSITSMLGGTGEALTAMINAEVNRQAAMIAYLDDFKLMMILTLCALPLVLLLRRPRATGPMMIDADAAGH